MKLQTVEKGLIFLFYSELEVVIKPAVVLVAG